MLDSERALPSGQRLAVKRLGGGEIAFFSEPRGEVVQAVERPLVIRAERAPARLECAAV